MREIDLGGGRGGKEEKKGEKRWKEGQRREARLGVSEQRVSS